MLVLYLILYIYLATQVSGNQAIDRGEKIYLKCNVTGGPHLPRDVSWYKDGHLITSREFPKTIITQYVNPINKTLITEVIVDRSVFSDTGVYMCRSKTLEAVKAKIRLQIGDTVHLKRNPVSEDLKEGKHFAAVYTSGSLQTDNSSHRLFPCLPTLWLTLTIILLVPR